MKQPLPCAPKPITFLCILSGLGLAALAVTVLAGCGKKSAEAHGSRAEPGRPALFDAWDLKGRGAAWQGAWVLPLQMTTKVEQKTPWAAMEVKGESAKVWNGAAELTMPFEVTSPCTMLMTKPAEPDGTIIHPGATFTVVEGQIVAGLGNAGVRRGKEAVACIDLAVYVLDAAGKCTRYIPVQQWRAEEARCGYRKPTSGDDTWVSQTAGSGEVFFAESFHHETVLAPIGDALVDQQIMTSRDRARKSTDFEAAKAAAKAAIAQ
jgi:hypothetical protein